MSKLSTAYVAHGGQTAADQVLETACQMAGHSVASLDAIDTARRFVRANIRIAAAEIEGLEELADDIERTLSKIRETKA